MNDFKFKEEEGKLFAAGADSVWVQLGLSKFECIDFYGGVIRNTRTFTIKKNAGISKVGIFAFCSSNGHLQGLNLSSTSGDIIEIDSGTKNNYENAPYYKVATLETDQEADISLEIRINAEQNFGFSFALFNISL